MAESKIEWTHYTFNPWRGCQRVSEGCRHCYAETLSKRNPGTLGVWGPQGTRVVGAESYWRLPLRWDREAQEAGERRRVFCASLADVFEVWPGPITNVGGVQLFRCDACRSECFSRDGAACDGCGAACRPLALDDVRARLFGLIARTPGLDWLLLTKRPENVLRMTYDAWTEPVPGHVSQNEGDGRHWHWPANVWLGVSVENQEMAEKRIPLLLQCQAAVRFLSVEPLLGPVDLGKWLQADRCQSRGGSDARGGNFRCGLPAGHEGACPHSALVPSGAPWFHLGGELHWVIVGGESGPQARPCHLEWVRALVAQCKAAGAACFVKQLGARVLDEEQRESPVRLGDRLRLRDSKGGDMSEWPEDLRVREFPR